MFAIDFYFDITFPAIIALLVGIYCGSFITFLIYVKSIIKSLNKAIKITREEIDDSKKSRIIKEINSSKEVYKYKLKHKEATSMSLLSPFNEKGLNKDSITYELIYKIALAYHPKAKEPLKEISIGEMLNFISHLTNQINEVISTPGIEFVKRIKVNTILKAVNVAEYVKENKIFQVYNENKKIFSILLMLMKILNPVTWIKKLIIQPIIKLLSVSICTSLIEFIGLEAYFAYSKENKEELLEVKK